MEDARKWLGASTPSICGLAPRVLVFPVGEFDDGAQHERGGTLLKEALEMGLKQDHDKAAVKLNLAVVASAKRKTKLAKALLNECKRLDAKGVLKKDIKQVEAAIRSPQQMRMRGR